jgi:hypothetical protein
MLGYGFDEGELSDGVKLALQNNVPTAIILDSGSTDGGPEKLATGLSSQPRSVYKRDLRKLIDAIRTFHVPVILGSAGGDGSNAHVEEFLAIIDEICHSDDFGYIP